MPFTLESVNVIAVLDMVRSGIAQPLLNVLMDCYDSPDFNDAGNEIQNLDSCFTSTLAMHWLLILTSQHSGSALPKLQSLHSLQNLQHDNSCSTDRWTGTAGINRILEAQLLHSCQRS